MQERFALPEDKGTGAAKIAYARVLFEPYHLADRGQVFRPPPADDG